MSNYTQVTATNITDAAGNKLASGTISFVGTDATNRPIPYQCGGGGQVVTTPATATITNGAIVGTFQVANPANTIPAGIFYQITITDTNLKKTVASYSLVSFAGDIFNLDNYAPTDTALIPPIGSSISGPLVVDGNLSVTGTILTGVPGSGTTTKLGTFSIAATTWTVTHNFGTQAVVAQCYDNSWHQIIPDTLTQTDVNTTTATFVQAQTGYMVVVNVGNWTPSVANPNYIIGNPTSSQSITGDYPFTLGGSLAAKRIEGIRYADQFSGADIGAQINAAYADLPSSGGQINVPAKSDGTAYNFSTPITFTTSGKYVLLVGVAGNSGQAGCALNYTPTTATAAITLDYAPAGGGGYTSNHGLVNIVLQNNGNAVNFGNGSSATGIAIGNVNGGAGHATFQNCRVSGFGTGFLKTNPTSWGQKFDNCSFVWNTTGVSLSSNENDTFYNCEIAVNSTGVVLASSEATFFGGSIDSNNIAGVNATGAVGTAWASFHGVHFENLGVSSATSTHYLTGSSNWQLFGGIMLNDNTTGTADYYISAQGNNLSIYGTQFQSSGQTVTCVVSLAGGSGAVRGSVAGVNISPTTGITTIVDTAASGRLVNVTDLTIVAGNSNAQTSWRLQPSLQLYEQTAPSGASNSDFLWADSTAHRLKMNNNSGGADTIVGAATTDTLTNKTLTSPALTTPTIGGGTSFSRYARYAPTLSPVAVAANTTAEQSFASVLTSGDVVVGVSKPTAQAGLGIVGWRASGTTLFITFANNTGSPITPTASEVYQVVAVQ